MRTLKDYVDMQKLTGASDMDVIIEYFVDNDMEEKMMEVSHRLAKAKIEKMSARRDIVKEWTYVIPSDYLYEKYPVKTATMLHRIELDYIVNGEVTGGRFTWAKENCPYIEEPKIYFQPCARWLRDHGIEFKAEEKK
jgi:hypothetical protein